MTTATQDTPRQLPKAAWGNLPPRMRVLFITGLQRTGGWLAEAFAVDSAVEVLLEETVGVAAGLARLRDEAYDSVLISHEGESLDALGLVDAIRAGSSDQQPIVVLGNQSEQEMAAFCYEAGADAYICVNTTTTRTLIWTVAMAMERHQLRGENRRLQQEHRHRLQREHGEAQRLLQQQRTLIADPPLQQQAEAAPGAAALGVIARDNPLGCWELPQPLVLHYQELLRAYVIMGSGNLAGEMNRLAEMLAAAGATAHQALFLHLHVLEEMIRGLGNRSARHVMNRADLLMLEVIINLAEDYRQRASRRERPPHQPLLPGFDDPADFAF